ncbi:spore coat U domain-containing protein [Alkalilimnicola ehrlichii MLHE-1]|uniref:Spore coat U domain protein n=1 Tax=Alkalilimnicola ehrlichii (strain ATCC BAA-1101 / DSM 17681 / MLHE-1) TaxID=187272 RepID=Q0AAK3_ALKEH|nr:spore coat U domain-containing protein [Alkalilimnicola ehrlichii]ABI56134.1 Spore coat U domain protein [Alkalilimnicola ehrlichii MLHE-1]
MKFRLLLALAALYPASMTAVAQTDTATFDVTATVDPTCTVDADNLVFGTYDPFSDTPLDENSEIRVQCTSDTPYDIGLDDGDNTGAEGERRMALADESDFLEYDLYHDNHGGTSWGDIDSGAELTGLSGTGSEQSYVVYGRIFAEQSVAVGNYVDTIEVTVKW